jgi:hypothetical protein
VGWMPYIYQPNAQTNLCLKLNHVHALCPCTHFAPNSDFACTSPRCSAQVISFFPRSSRSVSHCRPLSRHHPSAFHVVLGTMRRRPHPQSFSIYPSRFPSFLLRRSLARSFPRNKGEAANGVLAEADRPYRSSVHLAPTPRPPLSFNSHLARSLQNSDGEKCFASDPNLG